MQNANRAEQITALMYDSIPTPFMRLITLIAEEAEQHGVGVYVVGGFVRDLLLERMEDRHHSGKADLDFVVQGNAIEFANAVAARLGGMAQSYPQFGTATWKVPVGDNLPSDALVDFVTARREHYPQPGILPVVEPSTIEDDLARRDFTINAIAIQLAPAPFGTLLDLFDGEQDLRNQSIRVLHHQSFIDDATRIFRAVRFEQRFNFHLEAETEALLPAALPTLDVISGERIRTEFDLIYLEHEPERILLRLDQLGVLAQLDNSLIFDEKCFKAYRRARLGVVGWLNLPMSEVYDVILGCRTEPPEQLAQRLHMDRHRTKRLIQGHELLAVLPRLEVPLNPSGVVNLLDGYETAPLAAAWGISENPTARDAIAQYLQIWQHIHPTLTGDKLKTMGLLPGPHFGMILKALRQAWLDGDISTPDEESVFVQQWLNSDVKGNS